MEEINQMLAQIKSTDSKMNNLSDSPTLPNSAQDAKNAVIAYVIEEIFIKQTREYKAGESIKAEATALRNALILVDAAHSTSLFPTYFDKEGTLHADLVNYIFCKVKPNGSGEKLQKYIYILDFLATELTTNASRVLTKNYSRQTTIPMQMDIGVDRNLERPKQVVPTFSANMLNTLVDDYVKSSGYINTVTIQQR